MDVMCGTGDGKAKAGSNAAPLCGKKGFMGKSGCGEMGLGEPLPLPSFLLPPLLLSLLGHTGSDEAIRIGFTRFGLANGDCLLMFVRFVSPDRFFKSVFYFIIFFPAYQHRNT